MESTRCEDPGASIPTQDFYPGPAVNEVYSTRDQVFVQQLPVNDIPGSLGTDGESGMDGSGDWRMQDATSGYILFKANRYSFNDTYLCSTEIWVLTIMIQPVPRRLKLLFRKSFKSLGRSMCLCHFPSQSSFLETHCSLQWAPIMGYSIME